MAKKIYDFLPGHLKNSELETVFETTLDRVFSVGEMEKTKAFVGRREKGIYNSKDAYLSFPTTAYARDNYGLEPTFTNTNATDNIFYDDLLNALYNKGALTNDHRRLFKSTLETVQLPIDLDKFVNYSMYYWVEPGFATDVTVTAGAFVSRLEYTILAPGDTDFTLIGLANNNITSGSFDIGTKYKIVAPGDTDFTLIGLANNNITSGSFVTGTEYKIVESGTTDFILIGAADNNVGTRFIATSGGTGDGTATTLGKKDDYFIATGIGTGTGTATTIGTIGDVFVATGVGTYQSEFVDVGNEPVLGTAKITITGTAKENKHYVTIDTELNQTETETDFWRTNNSWYHYDDIKSLITDDNFKKISQALRPIIEFDKNIELSDTSAATTIASSFDFPTFKSYVSAGLFVIDKEYTISALNDTDFTLIGALKLTSGNFTIGSEYIIKTIGLDPDETDYTLIGAANNDVGTVFTATGVGTGEGTALLTTFTATGIGTGTGTATEDIKIFHYVTSTNYAIDAVLEFPMEGILPVGPKKMAGDYQSEFVFNIDLLETSTYKYDDGITTNYKKLYDTTTFDYRNLRQELGDMLTVSEIELLQPSKTFNTIDLYVDGQKQIGNYTYNSADNKITMTEAVSGNIYVDYCTNTPVIYDGQTVFQRINPAVEYNIDNKSYVDTEMTYSLVFEHFVRIIETVSGLTGSAIANNNYRTSGTNTDKLRFANQGSVLIRNTVDIKEAYFALTRDDYDPIKATEFLTGAYNGYKNKLLTTIISILESSASTTKTDLQILEEAISTISLGKHSSVSIFKDSTMLNFGENHSHYQTQDVTAVYDNTHNRDLPTFDEAVTNKKDLVIIRSGVIQRLNVDYTLNTGITAIEDITPVLSAGDTLTVRHYSNIKETYIPQSATSLGIAPAYVPKKDIIDSEYEPDVSFIRGHDGSLIPAYPLVDLGNGPETNRIDTILLTFETLIFNNLTDNTSANIDSMNYGLYDTSGVDYSNAEKKYIMYPFFKKWMMRNNIDSLDNDSYDASDYKTWNYRAKNENSSGHWRGQLLHAYGTDRPLQEPWKAIKLSQKPVDFWSTYGPENTYNTVAFWQNLIDTNSLTCPVPVDSSGNLKEPKDLFFGGVTFTSDEIALMDQAWEFGDNSPVELAWTRSSEFAFAEFMLMLLSNPFKVIYDYSTQIRDIITYSNKNEGIDTSVVVADKSNYSFKLGSKLGGFVNNFKLQTENNSLSNSRFTELPVDNYDLVVHAGVPNRSEYFSAIVLEKVSLDKAHPIYALADITNYYKGLIVLNTSDKKYYKRKIDGVSTKESGAVVNFDYSSWTLISQPKTSKFGFRVHGYDEINPTFYSMGWDKASGEKTFSTAGDKLTLKQWQSGEYYRLDSYILWNDTPYICLTNHTSTTFDDNIKDWKAVTEWPTTNKTQAKGYKELVDDTIKNYNYGDILESVDDVAHLIMGYEHYLGLVGWEFTDSDEFGDVINWENLLNKFLEWQSEQHDIGDFITLTPLLTGGSFDATYGVASVASETFKNYYRVVDSSGRLIPNTELSFHTDGAKLSFTSTVPVYGMKIDIRDIEHAFVVDRVDSYEDVIYDPHSHTRNLRMQIDCNRTVDWDGTMSVDGYLVNGNQLIPNFDTMVEETRHYRNTLVDQGLSIINKLKSNHYGHTTRAYLSNHGIERESQLEFYKGFLSHKGTDSSIDKIINNNGNFKNITHADIWAVKLSDYGHVSSQLKMTKDVIVNDMITDPFLIDYGTQSDPLLYNTTKNDIAIKTTGYVDASDVNYITSTHSSLTDLTGSSLYEGDTVWVQFDTDREWDVVRLSEVAEISYVGETSDNQLYIGVLTEIDSTYDADAIYLKISNDEIDPTIDGYYLLIANGTKVVDGVTIYEYLVFEEDFEPVIVEIDSATTNSIFVPTNTDSGVEAIGTVSNPIIVSGDILVVDGTSVSYTPSSGTISGITILGSVANPVVSEGEQARFVVYDDAGLVENGTNTTVTFSGTVAKTTGAFSSTIGDQVTIDGTTLTVDYSASSSISLTSTAIRSSTLTTGNTVIVDGVTKTVADLSVTGTAFTGTMATTKPLQVNGDTITLPSGSDITAIIDAINTGTATVVASNSGSDELVLTTASPELDMSGSVLQDLGISSTTLYYDSKLDNLASDINTITNITCTVSSTNNMTVSSSGTQMIISGTALLELGITAGTYLTNSNPTINSVVDQINALSLTGVTATVVTGTIKITSTNHNLDIVEVTSGAMSRIGFASTTIAVDATDTIVSDLNTQVFQSSTTTATKSDRQVLITSSESSIVTANITGNPLSDMGITAGTYSNTSIVSSSAVEFAAQITSATSVVVGVSSDGRMIFTNDNVSMSFSGTTEAILTKIGLSLEYSNITSSANFKAMLWKSIRYTPNFNGATFTEFTNTLGLNSTSKIWNDSYDADGWAVLDFNLGNYSIHARQAKTINTDLTKRLIVQDGENFINHQLYDPLNLKMPGTIVSKLEYIAWNDPASYDTTTSSDIWLDEKLDKIWWDTDLARFYRYNDYGDANGNLNTNYVKKYWGKLVDSSEVVVKKWTKSRIVPEVTTYNIKKYYDDVANKEVTDYFYWSTESDDCKEIAMLINSEGPKNKFLPVGTSSVIISNNATLYDSETISTTLEYQQESEIHKRNTDWELLSEATDYVVPNKFLNDMTESVSNVTILKTHAAGLTASQLTDVNHAIIPVSWITGLTVDDLVVTTNSNTVQASYLSIDGGNLKISQTHTMIAGDILRVYKVASKTDNWFSNNTRARSNFASIINNTMSKKMLTALYSNYTQYLDPDDIIFSLSDWYLNDTYKTIDSFSYLSTTRNFDMVAEYEKGIKSFKLKLPTHDEYYFEHDNVLQLVNRSKSALNVSFDSLVFPETSFDAYYNNAIGIQIHELMNMIKDYPDVSFINSIFFTMINYLYTEKTYPSWLFKTSYIDLNLYNRDLKQHAVYQRDSEEDVLEYVREAKPYHVKIREIKRMHSTAESFNTTVTIDERNADTSLNFGIGISVPSGFFAPGTAYTILTLGDDVTDIDFTRIGASKLSSGNFVIGSEYIISAPGTTDFTLIGFSNNINAGNFVIGTEYKIVSINESASTPPGADTDFTLIGAADNNVDTIFTATGVGTGTGIATTLGARGEVFKATGVGTGTGTALLRLFTATGRGTGTGTAQKGWRSFSRYEETLYDTLMPDIDDRDLEQGSLISYSNHTFTAGLFKVGTQYQIQLVGTTDFTLIGADDNDIGTQFTATGIGTGTGKALEITIDDWHRFSPTSGDGGFDTGFVKFGGLESSIVRLQTYTDVIFDETTGAPLTHSETIDKTQFYVYDIYGRGYSIDVTGTGTISSFDGTTLVVDQAVLFDDASDTNKQLIAVQKSGNSDMEFMLYDNKDNTSLTISNRVLYTGVGHAFTSGSIVHVLDTPLQLIRNNDEELENLL